MLYKSFYIGPEKFVKIFNFERCFSNGTFNQIRINCTTTQNSNIFKL